MDDIHPWDDSYEDHDEDTIKSWDEATSDEEVTAEEVQTQKTTDSPRLTTFMQLYKKIDVDMLKITF